MFLSPLLTTRDATHRLVNVSRGTVVATHLEPAFDSKSRNRGLLGRDGLADGRAMVIAPSNSIHMFFMRFAIDVLFVAKDGRVIRVRENLRPWRIALSWRAFAVIEGPVGMIAGSGTRSGDKIAVQGPPGCGCGLTCRLGTTMEDPEP